MSTWTWTFEDADGRVVEPATAPPQEALASQADAETWVGQHWRDLVAGGAEAARLWRDDVRVYGPMALRPAE